LILERAFNSLRTRVRRSYVLLMSKFHVCHLIRIVLIRGNIQEDIRDDGCWGGGTVFLSMQAVMPFLATKNIVINIFYIDNKP